MQSKRVDKKLQHISSDDERSKTCKTNKVACTGFSVAPIDGAKIQFQ